MIIHSYRFFFIFFHLLKISLQQFLWEKINKFTSSTRSTLDQPKDKKWFSFSSQYFFLFILSIIAGPNISIFSPNYLWSFGCFYMIEFFHLIEYFNFIFVHKHKNDSNMLHTHSYTKPLFVVF
jgi:hypothetical protein